MRTLRSRQKHVVFGDNVEQTVKQREATKQVPEESADLAWWVAVVASVALRLLRGATNRGMDSSRSTNPAGAWISCNFHSCAVGSVLFELWRVMYCNVMDGWNDVHMPCRFAIAPDCTKCVRMRAVYIYSIQTWGVCTVDTHGWTNRQMDRR